MLVNIGSGVSILKVTGDNEYSRISGSSLGGGTFWGLSRLLTGVSSFDEILQLSAKGNNRSVIPPLSFRPSPTVLGFPAALQHLLCFAPHKYIHAQLQHNISYIRTAPPPPVPSRAILAGLTNFVVSIDKFQYCQPLQFY